MEEFSDVKNINEISRRWALDTAGELLDEIERLNIVDSGTLFRKLRYRLGYHFGEVEKIAYAFPRYGVFVAKGVGRGRGIKSPAAKRYARNWYNRPLDDRLPQLAEEIGQAKADAALKAVKIK